MGKMGNILREMENIWICYLFILVLDGMIVKEEKLDLKFQPSYWCASTTHCDHPKPKA